MESKLGIIIGYIDADKEHMSQNLLSLIKKQLSLVLDPKINDIGHDVYKAISSLSPKDLNQFDRIISEYQSNVGQTISNLFSEASSTIFRVLKTSAGVDESLICGIVSFLKWKIKEELFVNKLQSFTESATRRFAGFGMKANIASRAIEKALVEVTAKNLIRSNLAKIENDLHLLVANHESPEGEEMSAGREIDVWLEIEKDYDVSKKMFGRKINFIKSKFRREIIFRDVGHAYCLANNGFSKPAVILAGSVIEELLRVYLERKNVKARQSTFNSYLDACQDNGLLKTAIHRLSDSVRCFRNLVHLAEEKSSKYSISKATAKGAVSSIFTIINDFDSV
ncbi:MAG: hypothetical protein A2283_15810 [Lentisphaerae bacterium RIFOXYA12_FULL_48_11]|nr:MAG: hypothetical protein A2283_15810 [Lentisphaerae bacterium RIFOXYA12_FULL_48_11]